MQPTKRIAKNYRLPADLVERIDRAARVSDISQTTLVKLAIQEKIEKIEKQMPSPLDK